MTRLVFETLYGMGTSNYSTELLILGLKVELIMLANMWLNYLITRITRQSTMLIVGWQTKYWHWRWRVCNVAQCAKPFRNFNHCSWRSWSEWLDDYITANSENYSVQFVDWWEISLKAFVIDDLTVRNYLKKFKENKITERNKNIENTSSNSRKLIRIHLFVSIFLMLFKDLDQKLVHLRQQQPRVFNQASGCERIRENLLCQQRCQLLVGCNQFVELHDDRMPDKKRSSIVSTGSSCVALLWVYFQLGLQKCITIIFGQLMALSFDEVSRTRHIFNGNHAWMLIQFGRVLDVLNLIAQFFPQIFYEIVGGLLRQWVFRQNVFFEDFIVVLRVDVSTNFLFNAHETVTLEADQLHQNQLIIRFVAEENFVVVLEILQSKVAIFTNNFKAFYLLEALKVGRSQR